MKSLFACLGVLIGISSSDLQGRHTEAARRDRVLSLPGWGPLHPLRMFSGYLPVGSERGARVFYTFTESESDPAADPLILWLQGGPGCSAAGTGTLRLNGPFFFDFEGRGVSRLRLRRNHASWTKTGSLLFLDTPLWVGWSRAADNNTGRQWDDASATALNLSALLAFFDRFPALRRRPLFLTGHSYSGHYTPLLARAVLQHNAGLPADQQPLRLAGVALGNPWTSPRHDNAGAVEAWYGQGVISRPTYDGLRRHCNFSATVLWRTDGESGVRGKCGKHRDAALQEAAGYNLYGFNAPLCALGSDGVPLERQPKWQALPSPTFDPCAPQRADAYLNRRDVQRALHAIPRGQPARPWLACNSRGITYDVASLLTPMPPVHRALIDAGVRLLVYSGDSDGVVPTRATRAWVEGLGLQPAGRLRPWRDQRTNQTAGYLMPYRGLTLATVHQAGHHVPFFQPARTLQLLAAFLADAALP